MVRRRWLLWITVVVTLGGCGIGTAGESLDRLHQQARDALARYDKAVQDAGGATSVVPVGEVTGQIGDWEPQNGQNKAALLDGRVVVTTALPTAPQAEGEVVWDSGATQTIPLISAADAIRELPAPGAGNCPDCVPLEVTGARLTTARIQTTRGPATVSAWEYTLKGTAVRVTRPAFSGSALVKVVPPSWDPYNAPAGLRIESATTAAGSTQLTAVFIGAPGPGSQPCGADYTGEAVESANAVVVIVLTHPHGANEACTAIGARRTTVVELAQPLGERAVLEVQQGLPVPVTITA